MSSLVLYCYMYHSFGVTKPFSYTGCPENQPFKFTGSIDSTIPKRKVLGHFPISPRGCEIFLDKGNGIEMKKFSLGNRIGRLTWILGNFYCVKSGLSWKCFSATSKLLKAEFHCLISFLKRWFFDFYSFRVPKN